MDVNFDRRKTLHWPDLERDACGTGFVANISGQPSHRIVALALEAVVNLTHRGAIDADMKSGDGAGILTQLPHKLLRREVERLGKRLGKDSDLGVALVFFPRHDPPAAAKQRQIFEETLQRHGLAFFGWRQVPTEPSVLGDKALSTMPDIQQALIGRRAGLSDEEFERTLYLARKEIEKRVCGGSIESFYIPSMSHRSLVYKGLFVAPQLKGFYKDLSNPDYESALALLHQRYSTNTFPNWFLAQPFRFLAHNGEINTLTGNRNWMKAREKVLTSPVWEDKSEWLAPVIQKGGSDSASLDNAYELLLMSGRDPLHAMMMLIPEAWENMPNMDPDWRAFYQYHAALTEPWDGPAALAFSDGVLVGAALDRNGLRPARYKIDKSGLIVMASEVGVVPMPDESIEVKGRLGPGQMIAVDTAKGVLLTNESLKKQVSTRKPYALWLKEHFKELSVLASPQHPDGHHLEQQELLQQQLLFGWTSEDIQFVTKPMMVEGKEPIGSMGDDTPLGVLSSKSRLLFSYFKQRFAQVTNPPIDPLREQIVMSLDVYLGPRRSLLEETPEHAHLLHLSSPILKDHEIEALRHLQDPSFASATLACLFPVADGPKGMEKALKALCREASQAVDQGKTILILNDKGCSPTQAPIPMLLAVGAVHHHLLRAGKRMNCSIICEAGEAREVHHFGALLGYGASAIYPYLAYSAIHHVVAHDEVQEVDVETAIKNFKKASDDGILKIMSKMGISTLSGYMGAQIFEAIGISDQVLEECFTDTPCGASGIGYEEIARDVLARHKTAFTPPLPKSLDDWGFYRFRKGGEYHDFNPISVRALHTFVKSNKWEDYQAFSDMINRRLPMTFRDLVHFNPDRQPIPLEEVEPLSEIMKRFATAGMSLGATSPEATDVLTIAMNRIGGMSNTGEGGEDPVHYQRHDGDDLNSKIKQVASARFGVTINYLAHAEWLEIKMAQGSKPGEGGQLPGHKVAPHIAKLRRAVPGIPLISPPPHHDIYSIEDLAQLIYDLKQANPRAKVAVKLVAEAGVGTIAAGVAKAYADVVLISGHDGGTGASPLSSIKNAGVPWELGVAETQQVLMLNGLRDRIIVKTDGGMKTGRDVVIAAMLGAEDFAFGTAALVAAGCQMARQCHLNTCPVGIATQREDLRAKFTGKPEHVVAYFTAVATEVRQLLASLGYCSLEEIIGRVDLLQPLLPKGHPKAGDLDLTRILADVDPSRTLPRRCIKERNDRPGDVPLDLTIIQDCRDAIEMPGHQVKKSYRLQNHHRSVGTRLSGEVALRRGDEGLPPGSIDLSFHGTAGQSFGAFLSHGIRMTLYGEANDYVGKGMTGGEIIVRPPENAFFTAEDNVIMGNTVLYGATGGFLFVRGRAGERFAVRNSGATAVVEGTGDHCCEYMTGGTVVVLGTTGRNFGAGMSHGIAYVLDEEAELPQKVNKELVYLERVTAEEDQTFLKGLIQRHSELTGSQKAAHILARWASSIPLFWKVVPYPPTGVAGARGVVALVGRAAGRDLRGTAARPAPQAASKGATPSSPAGAQP